MRNRRIRISARAMGLRFLLDKMLLAKNNDTAKVHVINDISMYIR